MSATSWKQRPGHAGSGWRPCCVRSRPRPHVRRNGPASAEPAPLSPPMWPHQQKVKPSTMNGEPLMPTPPEGRPLVLRAGQIVLADWRGDAMPKEPNKRRPAVVVEDDALFVPSYPNVILVPLTEDAALAIPDLSVAIDPTTENGCSKPCWPSLTWLPRLRSRGCGQRRPAHLRATREHTPPDRCCHWHRKLRPPHLGVPFGGEYRQETRSGFRFVNSETLTGFPAR